MQTKGGGDSTARGDASTRSAISAEARAEARARLEARARRVSVKRMQRSAVRAYAELAPGARVRVRASVNVHHAKGLKGAALPLNGREGVVEARADYHNDRKIVTATLPLKVRLEGDPVVIAHLKEEEVEVLADADPTG